MSLAKAVGELYGELTRRYDSDTANALIDYVLAEHAHELAEKQRLRMAELDLTGQKARIVGRIVDLIDPEVE